MKQSLTIVVGPVAAVVYVVEPRFVAAQLFRSSVERARRVLFVHEIPQPGGYAFCRA